MSRYSNYWSESVREWKRHMKKFLRSPQTLQADTRIFAKRRAFSWRKPLFNTAGMHDRSGPVEIVR